MEAGRACGRARFIFRAQHINPADHRLTATPDFKWGSTNIYTEKGGKPVLRFQQSSIGSSTLTFSAASIALSRKSASCRRQ